MSKPKKKETAEEFITRLKKMPNLDLTDPQTIKDLAARFDKEVRPELEKIDLVHRRGGPRVFWRY